jgi:hypothetical protein
VREVDWERQRSGIFSMMVSEIDEWALGKMTGAGAGRSPPTR